jgi:cysteine sulfinate desulfinase/cysteine desulfurase-like protein
VIAALGAPSWVARGAIRVSLGSNTESGDLESFLDALGGIVTSAARAVLLEKETA